jgi:hypothetical protein
LGYCHIPGHGLAAQKPAGKIVLRMGKPRLCSLVKALQCPGACQLRNVGSVRLLRQGAADACVAVEDIDDQIAFASGDSAQEFVLDRGR